MNLSPFYHGAANCFARGDAGERRRALFKELQGQSKIGLPLTPGLISPLPLVASAELMRRLDERTRDITSQLIEQASRKQHDRWDACPPLDVLSIDFAIAHDERQSHGWSLRCVEAQGFTSIIATVHKLEGAIKALEPSLANTSMSVLRGERWKEQVRAWLAPHKDTFLVEDKPGAQPTFFDFCALAELFGLGVADIRDIERTPRNELIDRRTGKVVRHVLNRVVAGAHDRRIRSLTAAAATWHSHPAWYSRVSKQSLIDLELDPLEACVPAYRWQELGLEPHDLVLKDMRSYGGQGVYISPGLDQLTLAQEEHTWLVQPRYQSLDLGDGTQPCKVHAEIRCVVLVGQSSSWTCARFARVFHGQKASASSMNATDSWTGLAPVLSCPGHNWET